MVFPLVDVFDVYTLRADTPTLPRTHTNTHVQTLTYTHTHTLHGSLTSRQTDGCQRIVTRTRGAGGGWVDGGTGRERGDVDERCARALLATDG